MHTHDYLATSIPIGYQCLAAHCQMLQKETGKTDLLTAHRQGATAVGKPASAGLTSSARCLIQ
jgi:hypothetical protein